MEVGFLMMLVQMLCSRPQTELEQIASSQASQLLQVGPFQHQCCM